MFVFYFTYTLDVIFCYCIRRKEILKRGLRAHLFSSSEVDVMLEVCYWVYLGFYTTVPHSDQPSLPQSAIAYWPAQNSCYQRCAVSDIKWQEPHLSSQEMLKCPLQTHEYFNLKTRFFLAAVFFLCLDCWILKAKFLDPFLKIQKAQIKNKTKIPINQIKSQMFRIHFAFYYLFFFFTSFTLHLSLLLFFFVLCMSLLCFIFFEFIFIHGFY